LNRAVQMCSSLFHVTKVSFSMNFHIHNFDVFYFRIFGCDLVWWQVTLTWDETPHERMAFMARDFSKDELADQDLRDYVASDTDSDGMLLLQLLCVRLQHCQHVFCLFCFCHVCSITAKCNSGIKKKDDVGNTVEENHSIFSLIHMQCSSRYLQQHAPSKSLLQQNPSASTSRALLLMLSTGYVPGCMGV